MAIGDVHVFPGFLTAVLRQLSFQSHRPLFPHASAEVGGGNTPERKFTSTGYRTHESDTLTTEPPGRGTFSTVINPTQSVVKRGDRKTKISIHIHPPPLRKNDSSLIPKELVKKVTQVLTG